MMCELAHCPASPPGIAESRERLYGPFHSVVGQGGVRGLQRQRREAAECLGTAARRRGARRGPGAARPSGSAGPLLPLEQLVRDGRGGQDAQVGEEHRDQVGRRRVARDVVREERCELQPGGRRRGRSLRVVTRRRRRRGRRRRDRRRQLPRQPPLRGTAAAGIWVELVRAAEEEVRRRHVERPLMGLQQVRARVGAKARAWPRARARVRVRVGGEG